MYLKTYIFLFFETGVVIIQPLHYATYQAISILGRSVGPYLLLIIKLYDMHAFAVLFSFDFATMYHHEGVMLAEVRTIITSFLTNFHIM